MGLHICLASTFLPIHCVFSHLCGIYFVYLETGVPSSSSLPCMAVGPTSLTLPLPILLLCPPPCARRTSFTSQPIPPLPPANPLPPTSHSLSSWAHVHAHLGPPLPFQPLLGPARRRPTTPRAALTAHTPHATPATPPTPACPHGCHCQFTAQNASTGHWHFLPTTLLHLAAPRRTLTRAQPPQHTAHNMHAHTALRHTASIPACVPPSTAFTGHNLPSYIPTSLHYIFAIFLAHFLVPSLRTCACLHCTHCTARAAFRAVQRAGERRAGGRVAGRHAACHWRTRLRRAQHHVARCARCACARRARAARTRCITTFFFFHTPLLSPGTAFTHYLLSFLPHIAAYTALAWHCLLGSWFLSSFLTWFCCIFLFIYTMPSSVYRLCPIVGQSITYLVPMLNLDPPYCLYATTCI